MALYEIRRKIYPRAVTGVFAQWRWALVLLTQLVYYGLPWLAWDGRQAVLFDLGARKFYIFGLVFWPQDVVYLAVILILSALALFLFTSVAGRLWCGYACPQTVYTEMFLWVERKIEGERAARMKLDAAPLSAAKAGRKAAKHGAWIAISLWTGVTFVGYFTPIRELLGSLPAGLSGWETFWVLFYGFATYGNAGWMREQVCKYMCPYARFQSVMFDQDTMVITYDAGRGEPRGSRSRKVDIKSAGLGHCVDCGICVQVCPTGIDIRKGLQYECIGCAACIDGCDQVMDKMGYPKGLIRYTTENALARGYDSKAMWRRVFRFRTLLYTALLLVITTAAGVSLYLRNPLKVNVMRDRGALAREAQPGIVENVYRLQVMNTDATARAYTVTATGLKGLKVVGVDGPLALAAESSQMVPLSVQAPADDDEPATSAGDGAQRKRSHRIEIVVEAVGDPKVVRREETSFLFPR
ncbi:MAG: cytochrome c oxidase accessory protein CcoG [Betaproteobacteria bacterium]|nr:cytochrome c oxidase accessory protein CcoG [Betaproteobacteria bacterium]